MSGMAGPPPRGGGIRVFTVPFFLYLLAGALTVASAITPRIPLWIPVLLVCVGLLVTSGGTR